MSKKYNPKTRKWVDVPDDDQSKKKNSKKKGDSDSDDDSSLTSSSTSKKSAKGKAESEVNKKTLRTLEGSLSYIPTETTIRIVAGETIKLSNLGKYLSGKYYVKNVTRTLDSNGYSQSSEVIKTNFKKSVKVVAKHSETQSVMVKKATTAHTIKEQRAEGKKVRVHVVKKGETFYTIAKNYYKDSKKVTTLHKNNPSVPKSMWKKLPIGMKLII